MRKLDKIVLTGAAGALGNLLREPLAAMAGTLLSSDLADLPTPLLPGESFQRADLTRLDEIEALMEGADMVVHFGSIADEAGFEAILGPNLVGSYHVWEAASRHRVRRVVYASSVHAVGMYENADGIDLDAPHRPDTFYGLAKCYSENLGRLYWQKRGVEGVALRIFSCTPRPMNARALGTWLSHGDLVRLVRAAVEAPAVGYTAVFGLSANTRAPVQTGKAGFLGYVPQDNAEDWAEELLAGAGPVDPKDPQHTHLGGPFAIVDLGESGVELIKRLTRG